MSLSNNIYNVSSDLMVINKAPKKGSDLQSAICRQMNALRCLHRSGSGSRMLRNVQEKAVSHLF